MHIAVEDFWILSQLTTYQISTCLFTTPWNKIDLPILDNVVKQSEITDVTDTESKPSWDIAPGTPAYPSDKQNSRVNII